MNLIKSEFTKMRSVRSTMWSLLAMSVITVGISGLATLIYRLDWAKLEEADRQEVFADAIGLMLQPAMFFTQVAVCVFATLLVTAEYSSGTISATMLATPRRGRVLAAKAVVLSAVVYAVSEIIAFGAYLLGSFVPSPHVDVSLGDPGVLAVLLSYGLYMCVVALFSLGLATLIRNTAGAITAGVGFVLVAPIVISFIPGSLGERVAALMPGSANSQMILSTADATIDYPYSAEVALAIVGAWTLATLSLGAWNLRRRDV